MSAGKVVARGRASAPDDATSPAGPAPRGSRDGPRPPAAAEDRQVSFVRAGDSTLYPQGPCLPTSGELWFCPSRGAVAGTPGAGLVAYAVPRNQVEEVLRSQAVPASPAWGQAYEVR